MFIGIGLGLIPQAMTGSSVDALLGGNSLDNYGNAAFLFDVPLSTYRNGATQVGSFSSLTGLTFTRALAAYAPNSAGVLQLFASGAPRITDRGLLIEGARTNLFLRSQEFDNASWSATNLTISADAGIAPDGTQTADLCTVTTTATTNLLGAAGNRPAVTGTNCCASVYIQNGNRTETASDFVLRDHTAGVNKVTCTINWAAMTVSGAGASIERLGSTNWYRIVLVDTAWTSGNAAIFYPGVAGGSKTAGQEWYLWGSQIEAAAFPSSYIPTTSASVTRPADVCSIAVSGISYPATLFAEFEATNTSGSTVVAVGVENAGTNNDCVRVGISSTGAAGRYDVRSNNIAQAGANVGTVAAVTRMAVRVALNNVNAATLGTLGTADTLADLPITASQINMGYSNQSGLYLFGFIKRAAVWNSAFTDSQLQGVTS